MNDFSELESELKKLRPLPPSRDLFSRIGQELSTDTKHDTASGKVIRPERFRINWLSVGIALGAAAVLLIMARVDWNNSVKTGPTVASLTPAPRAANAILANHFIPAAASQVIYRSRDEGLVFRGESAPPLRRVRSHFRETLQWRNPVTGASLRVSYPSEQIELIPISAQ
jgi:hypothetical protein